MLHGGSKFDTNQSDAYSRAGDRTFCSGCAHARYTCAWTLEQSWTSSPQLFSPNSLVIPPVSDFKCEPAASQASHDTPPDSGGQKVYLRPLERHIHQATTTARLFIRVACGHNRHFQAAHLVDAIVVDFRKDQLLAQTKAVVATAIERVR